MRIGRQLWLSLNNHISPHVFSLDNSISNLRILCAKCNLKRGVEDLEYLEPYFNRERGCYWYEALAPYETSELRRLAKLSTENIESIKHGSKPGSRSKLLLN